MNIASDYLIALDDGHDPSTPGKRTPPIPALGGRVIRENEFNKAVKLYLRDELKRCGFRTLVVAPGDGPHSLETRVKRANDAGAHAYVSIHYNALDGEFDGNDPEGLSIHISPGSKEGRKLAEDILKHLKGGTSQRNRGIVESNFYVLNKTKMKAILSENGFMDNEREAMMMANDAFRREVAREHAMGICDNFGVKYIPAGTPPKVEQPTYGVLRKGSKGEGVKGLQEDLNKLGFSVGEVDGSFGPKTEMAVIKYQTSRGLEMDGIAGPITLGRLDYDVRQLSSFKPYVVRVTVSALNVRETPSTKAKITKVVYGGNAFTIIGEDNGWGKLKSGLGWIFLKHTEKV